TRTSNAAGNKFVSSIDSSIVVGNVGAATFNQENDSYVSATQFLQIARSGGTGTYNMDGGTLSIGSLDVGNAGTALFSQTNGTTTVANNLTLARGSVTTAGQVTISGGNLQVGSILFGASGTGVVPNLSTATLTVSGSASVKVTNNIDTGSVITSSITVN